MNFKTFSKKQLCALGWWCQDSPYKDCDAIICDGAVRSGKTLCMSISFILWSLSAFNGRDFAICGKTVRGVRRNVVSPLLATLRELGFGVQEKLSANLIELEYGGVKNRYYLFGGRDESSAALIQGITLAGVLFDEVALMPRSFVEQAIARCSLNGSKFWFNCNPEHPGHWFYREWILKRKEKNALYLHFKMEDNPSLSKKMLERYKSLYSGAFYRRFVEGEWVAAQGSVYPFMTDEMFCEVPWCEFEDYAVSVDYGTVNPASFGLWGLLGGVWYRIDEYYFDSRKEGFQRTDEEHYRELERLCEGKKISAVTVDPSAASFIEVIRRHGKFSVIPARNNVLDGIRQCAAALKEKRIVICRNCADSVREFSLYRWNENSKNDVPIKENDHAMDDIRYFVTTILNGGSGDFFAVAAER
ncbi:MAG: PBSX family phage terminase large subunit [Acutalibacteraceae bacterium]